MARLARRTEILKTFSFLKKLDNIKLIEIGGKKEEIYGFQWEKKLKTSCFQKKKKNTALGHDANFCPLL